MLQINEIAVTHKIDKRPLIGPVSFSIQQGEVFGLVGESGSGKSMTALALMRLTPTGTEISGSAELSGVDLVSAPDREMRAIRGRDMAMIFQEPVSALNPVFSLGTQLITAIRAHQKSRSGARMRAIELLRMVGIPDPEARLDVYPHQLSGGMCQRAMIAMALASGARFLIADEPTTSLDVTIQEQILQLVERLTSETGLSVLFISHDLGVVARLCHRVAVLYAGEVVEAGSAETLLHDPLHPYSQGLLRCVANFSQIGKVQRGIPGTPPSAGLWPRGCRFQDRCAFATKGCGEPQTLRDAGDGHMVRCWRAEDLRGARQ